MTKGMAHPNIVYIFADDMGYGDVSCYNPEAKLRTPHLDQLAQQGMRFTDAHAASAVCTPSRYSVLTGRYCWRSRLKRGVLDGYSPPLLEQGRMTAASLLQDHGYHTACIGKWHLGWNWPSGQNASAPADDPAAAIDFSRPIENGPRTNGFDWFYGISASLDMAPYCYIENERPTMVPDQWIEENTGEQFWRQGVIAPDFAHGDVLPHLTKKAVHYIGQRRQTPDQPFFLYFPLPAPHEPIMPTDAFRGKSEAGAFGDFCMQVDDVVGQIARALDEEGLSDNTLLIFTSDNGPERSAYKRILQHEHYSMGDFRGIKRDLWEAGHRVPFIARWPQIIPAGETCTTAVGLTDLLATLADVLSCTLPQDAGEDSLSMYPLLAGKPEQYGHREAIVYQSFQGELAIRKDDWVLIDAPSGANNPEPKWFQERRGYREHDFPGELYNLAADVQERDNLYARHPDKVAELKTLLARFKDDGRSVYPE